MNRIESAIYRILFRFPNIKLFVRNLYQSIIDLLPREKEYLPEGLLQIKDCYFGFHDVSQFSPDDTKILVLKNPFDGRMPKQGDTAEIGYYDFNGKEIGIYHSIGKTSAWNFHKGCREQWIDNEHIIYNTSIQGKLVCVISRINEPFQKVYDCSIDSVSIKTMMATSFSYERLEHCMPGYGYPYKDNSFLGEDSPVNTGLFIINLMNGERKLLISLKQMSDTAPEEYRIGYIHYVTHTEFSPDGSHISFLHRWIKRNGSTNKRWTRLMVYNIADSSCWELPSQYAVSHYVWNGNKTIIASSVIDGVCHHIQYDWNKIPDQRTIAPKRLNSDGHQTILTSNVFITDTYPDKSRMARLFKVIINTGECNCIAKVYSPKSFQTRDFKCHIACDLHPRISFSGKFLSFDSPRDGVRSVYIIPIDFY